MSCAKQRLLQRMVRNYVVLGDVVRSRNIRGRTEFRRRIEEGCKRANERFERSIAAEFKLLKGIDELGGVLRTPIDVYDVARTFTEVVRPHRIRLAVVFGEVDVGSQSSDVSKMDGPAFHRADELLSTIEKQKLLFDMETNTGRLDVSVSDEVNLLLSRRRNWTERQRETIETYREHGTQRDVAESLDVTQQAVSKTLNEAEWPMVETIEERLRDSLEELDRQSKGASTDECD